MALVEKKGSRTVNFTDNGLTGQTVYHSLWGERYALAPQIGTPFPDLIGLYASNVRLEPFGKSVAAGGYEYCKITVDYSSRDESREGAQVDGAILDESLEFAGEMLTKGDGKFDPVNGSGLNAPKEVVGGTWYPRIEYVTEKVISDINAWIRKIRKRTGKVNSTTWKGGKKEHWLFEGASARSFTNNSGAKMWRIVFRFVYREEISWQEAWNEKHPDGARFEEVYFVDDGGAFTKKLYETTSFGPLEL